MAKLNKNSAIQTIKYPTTLADRHQMTELNDYKSGKKSIYISIYLLI